MRHEDYQSQFPVPQKLRNVPPVLYAGRDIVELGCNRGDFGAYVLSLGAASYVGYDFNASTIAHGQATHPTLDLRHGTHADIPDTCDLFVALGVFHHIPDAALVSLLQRVRANTILCEQPMHTKSQPPYHIRSHVWYEDALMTLGGYQRPVRYEYGFGYPYPRAILVATR